VNADLQFETTKLTAKNTAFFTTGAVSHELRAGVELIRRERLDAASAPGGTDDRFALFAVNEMSVGPKLTSTPALRYETSSIEAELNDGARVSYDNDALVGGLSVRYAFEGGFSVFASGAYTESLPILDDLENPELMDQPKKARRVGYRRRLSLTPLIDVIFLLLLLFMLTSTFTPFAELELGAAGTGAAAPETPPMFLRVSQEALSLNGRAVALAALAAEVTARAPEGAALLVSLGGEVGAQRLTAVLVALAQLERPVTLLGR
jgi:biopolymer transport protein ExbD